MIPVIFRCLLLQIQPYLQSKRYYPKKYPNFPIPRCAIRSLMLQNDYVLETSRSIGVSRSD
jgi:hypothetical protein